MVDCQAIYKNTKSAEIYSTEIILRDESLKEVVSINRGNGQVTKKSNYTGESPLMRFPIYGIYGSISLPSANYLLIITQANYVGELLSHKIFQIAQVAYIPTNQSISYKSISEINYPAEDRTYIEMLKNFFEKRFLYYSYDYNLTATIQNLCETNFDKTQWRTPFFYNEHMLKDFIQAGCLEWVAPVMSGFIEIHHLTISKIECQFALISRRDKSRTGMRFVSRGCDLDGNASNTAETEQILIINKKIPNETKVYSFVQIRGSLPFMWAQKPTLKWSPKALILTSPEHNVEVARKHLDTIVKNYGNIVLVNLIDKKGTQKTLGEEFNRVTQVINDAKLKLIWFDFHHECRGMKYENLSKLLAQIQPDVDKMTFFEAVHKKQSAGSAPSIVSRQSGTVRTNCIDSLDRTNVVQSVVGRRTLHDVLKRAELSTTVGTIAPFETLPGDLEKIFRETWTNNANAMSLLYTGTNALKTDFTKVGKRTWKGSMDDGKSALSRYVKNNFYDGYNQDCLDLVLGRIDPVQGRYQRASVNRFYILLLFIIFFPFLVKIMLDSVHENLFNNNYTSHFYDAKASVFYYTVFLLCFVMLFKAISGNPQVFVPKPHNQH